MINILAPSGNTNECECGGPNQCAPGWFCTVPTPACPSVCFKGDECPECLSYNLEDWDIQYDSSGVFSYGQAETRTDKSVSITGPSNGLTWIKGTYRIAITYLGQQPAPECVNLTISSSIGIYEVQVPRQPYNDTVVSNGINADQGAWDAMHRNFQCAGTITDSFALDNGATTIEITSTCTSSGVSAVILGTSVMAAINSI